MIAPILVTLVLVGATIAHGESSLRGSGAIERANDFASELQAKQVVFSTDDNIIQSMIDQVIANAPKEGSIASHTAEHQQSGGDISELNYEGGNPELNYKGYIGVKYHANNDCSAPVVKLMAANQGCIRISSASSGRIVCGDGGENIGTGGIDKRRLSSHRHSKRKPPTSYGANFYNGTKCEGAPVQFVSFPLPPCSNGATQVCFAREETPAFLKQDGLITYKLADAGTCKRFASAHLGYWPDFTTQPDSDDALASMHLPTNNDDGGEGEGAYDDEVRRQEEKEKEHQEEEDRQRQEEEERRRREQEELDRLAEEQRLRDEEERRRQEEADGNNARRILSAGRPTRTVGSMARSVPFSAAVADATVSSALPVAPVRAAAVTGAIKNTATAAGAKSSHSRQTEATERELLVALVDGDREFALLHTVNGLCTYDEKYGLYIKTSCFGKVGKMVYHLFLDAACTRFINRVAHDLEKAVPNYGLCVVSQKYQDVKLTVCHNAGAAVVVKD